jgi:hypothetical protein
MTRDRDTKKVLRAIRNIPVDEPALWLADDEKAGTGLWCLVAGQLQWVPATGGKTESTWDDPIELAVMTRYIKTCSDRIHDTHSSAVQFVKSRFG